ncbi:MAG: FkbM family methyltransferase [Rhodobacteraceae bacterium]|nr:FkbM family methyltransferase [Paracoccaceae bacterium]
MRNIIVRAQPAKDRDARMPELDTIYGRIAAPDWPDDIILRSLAELGEWSFVEQQILARLVRAGDVLWDGGAFLGTFGIGVAQIAAAAGTPLSRLVAIEPGADLRPFVTANLDRNAPCDSLLIPSALGATEGRLLPMATEAGNHGALAYGTVGAETTADAGVDCQPLWQLRARHGDYTVLKLDVEGMEIEALKGDFDHIRDHKPVIWAECNESLSSLLLLEGMVAAGYAPRYIAFPAFRRANFRAEARLPYLMAYEAALLAAPPDRMALLDVSDLGEEIIVRPVTSAWDLRQALWATPRWADPAWANASRAELVALLGRMSRGEDLGRFLNDALRPTP